MEKDIKEIKKMLSLLIDSVERHQDHLVDVKMGEPTKFKIVLKAEAPPGNRQLTVLKYISFLLKQEPLRFEVLDFNQEQSALTINYIGRPRNEHLSTLCKE